MTDLNPIAAEAAVATRGRNGHHGSGRERRPAARSRIEAAAAANAHAAQAHQAVGDALGEMYANRLIALLDAEGLGAELPDEILQAILVIVRAVMPAQPLPQRQPGGNGTGPQPAQRMP
jgi:hypothetical protein